MRRSATLQFHPTGIRPAVRRKLILLALLFVLSAVFFFIVQNAERPRAGQALSAPTLPLLTLQAGGVPVNPLRAYRAEMNPGSMRGALLPLDETRTVTFQIRTFGAATGDMTYALYALGGAEQLDQGPVSDVSLSGNILNGSFVLPDVFTPNEEYLLRLELQSDGAPAYYYCRVCRAVECYEQDCLRFALQFHEAALSGDEAFVSPYLEASSIQGADTRTLARVSVTSPASQVCWGDFGGSRVADADITFTEINPTYTSLEFRYQMLRNSTGGPEYYNVREYFRIRITPTHLYLLDYQRQMTQQAGTCAGISSGALLLGVRSLPVSFLANDPGTVCAFVQAGELYEYDLATGTRRRIFSFLGSSPTDPRLFADSHRIRLLSIGENGSLDFAVYGYMSAGEHEGLCGISLFHYDAADQICEERLFLKSTDDYPLLSATLSDTMYVSGNRTFYLMQNGALISVDLDSLEVENVVRGLAPDQYAASESGRLFAYVKDGEAADTLRVIDLETLETTRISASSGEKLRPAAFYGENLIYGLVRDEDIGPTASGTTLYPMYRLVILSGIDKSAVQKTYEKSGYFVSKVAVEDDGLRLVRVVQSEGLYSETFEDRLLESDDGTPDTVRILTSQDTERGTICSLALSNAVSAPETVASAGASWIFFPEGKAPAVTAGSVSDLYIVYVGSEVSLATTRASEAVHLANRQMGVVIDNAQHVVWARSRPAYRNAFGGFIVSEADADCSSDVQALSALLGRENQPANVLAALYDGKTPTSVLQEAIPAATVLDLTGCELAETLYYVGRSNPVYAVTGTHEAVLIIGYTATSVSLYDAVTDQTRVVPMEEAEALFAANGSVYLSYVD